MITITNKKELNFNLSYEEGEKINRNFYNIVIRLKRKVNEAKSYNEFSKTSAYNDIKNELNTLFSMFDGTKFLKEYESELNEINNTIHEYLNKIYEYPDNYNKRTV